MAQKKVDSSNRSNKIRFVLVEADISDGNLSELTQAITSALKPTITPLRQIPRAPSQLSSNASGAAEESETEAIVEEPEYSAESNGNSSSSAKPARPPKKFKPPEYLPALLAKEKGTAFKEFAKEKAPATKSKKYLVATYWLKEHGESPTVNADKIYTCFKTAAWSTGFNDWNQTFHNLVHSEHLRKEEGNGCFAINPLGEDAVIKGTE
jgi:hypothetical protein